MKLTWVSMDRELFYELAAKYQFEFSAEDGVSVNISRCKEVMDNHGNSLRRLVDCIDSKFYFKYYIGVEIWI